jgi:DUF4097 and DUF4098 domain-containing protein YvlB
MSTTTTTRTRTERQVGLWIGGGLAVLLTLWTALQIAAWTVGAVHRDQHWTLAGTVRTVPIQVDSGDLTVLPATDGRVTVDSRAQGSLWLPHVKARLDGDAVRVSGDCRAISIGRCKVAFVVHVPPGVPVVAHTSSGDVDASGLTVAADLSSSSGDVEADDLSGGARLATSSGDVRARGLSGDVHMETSSGDVEGADLRAASVSANVSSGDIELSFAAAPQTVDAVSSSGDVDVLVPPGGSEAYRVDVDTSSGDRSIRVRTDPASDRSLRAVTSSGDVTVAYTR